MSLRSTRTAIFRSMTSQAAASMIAKQESTKPALEVGIHDAKRSVTFW